MTEPVNSITVPNLTTTAGDGSVLVGVDPPRQQWQNVPTPEFRFTQEDLQKAREQEKTKLYGQIETLTAGQKAMNDELDRLRVDRETREKTEQERLDAAEAQARKTAEDEMDVRQLLDTKEKEWAERFTSLQQERQMDRTLLEREREYSQLAEYRNRRVNEMADDIIPELQDLVTGNTPQEIEQSLAGLVDRSAKIIDSATNAAQAARRDMRGTGITAPAAGPLEEQSGQTSISQADLAAMPMSEYVKHRASLLNLASQSKRGLLG